MNARFDGIPDAGHFPQNTHGPELVELILQGQQRRLNTVDRSGMRYLLRSLGSELGEHNEH